MLIAEFDVVAPEIDELALACSDPRLTAERIAEAKAQIVYQRRPQSVVIAADTIVAVADSEGGFVQLGKPRSPAEAVEMLTSLSGRSHIVVTGVSVLGPDLSETFSETTKVWFHPLTKADIERYVRRGESLDKAGGYAIQGGAAAFAARIEGSVSNVIGLPTETLARKLKSYGLEVASQQESDP